MRAAALAGWLRWSVYLLRLFFRDSPVERLRLRLIGKI
jgi:hypothetical protein